MLPHGCPPTRAAVQPAVALCRCLLLALSPCTCRLGMLQAGHGMCSWSGPAVSRGCDGSPSRLAVSDLAKWWPGGSGSRTWGVIKSGFFPSTTSVSVLPGTGSLPVPVLLAALPL